MAESVYHSQMSGTPPAPPPKPVEAIHNSSARASPFTILPSTYGLDTPAVAAQHGPQNNLSSQSIVRPESGWLPAALQDKSVADLRQLLENPKMLSMIINNPDHSHPSVAASQAPVKDILHRNHEQAKELQQLEAQLLSQRAFAQSRLLALRALEQQHRSKIAETEHSLQAFSPMNLYQRLGVSAQEQDTLLKTLEESFFEQDGVASDQEVSSFLRRVREIKRAAFLRNERKKRWDEGRVGGWR